MFHELFSRKGLKLDRLIALCEVAEAGGYTKAAHQDPNRQSHLSKQIAELEEVFGTELLKGHGKGATLTAEGARLIAITREFLQALQHFDADCRNKPLEFSIGAGDALLQWLLFPRIADIQKQLPNVTLDVRNLKTSQVAEQVSDFRLHFGILRKDAVPKGHECESLGQHTYSLFVPKSFLPNKTQRAWEQVIAKAPIATISGDGVFRAGLLKEAKRLGVTLKCTLACSSFPQAAKALETESFAAILPTIASNDLDGSRFEMLDAPFLRKQTREICLTWNRRLIKLRPETAQVKECLAEILKFPN